MSSQDHFPNSNPDHSSDENVQSNNVSGKASGKNKHYLLSKKAEFINKVKDFTGKGKFKKAARSVGLSHIENSQLSKWYTINH